MHVDEFPADFKALYVPAAQTVQFADAAEDQVPGGHGKQETLSCAPSCALKEPAGQEVQFHSAGAPLEIPNIPAGQFTQAEELEAPSVALYVPTGHGVHIVAL
eukprot:ANDGO_07750.mRNA.1 hypothetical protein